MHGAGLGDQKNTGHWQVDCLSRRMMENLLALQMHARYTIIYMF